MDQAVIRDQINKILSSRTFAGKSQLRKLLEVLSRNLDSQTTLKPDRVIRELWPDEVRTKGSADVATEMNRLRHALDSYYAGEGGTDPIIVFLPNRAAPRPTAARKNGGLRPRRAKSTTVRHLPHPALVER